MKGVITFLAGVILSPIAWILGKSIVFLIGIATLAWLATLVAEIMEEESANG